MIYHVIMGHIMRSSRPVFVTTDKKEAEAFMEGAIQANENNKTFGHLKIVYEYYTVVTVDQSYLD